MLFKKKKEDVKLLFSLLHFLNLPLENYEDMSVCNDSTRKECQFVRIFKGLQVIDRTYVK